MYLTIVDETGSCRLLIMLGDELGDGLGARCWVTIFSHRIDRMLLQEIFRHHFLIIIVRLGNFKQYQFISLFFIFIFMLLPMKRLVKRNYFTPHVRFKK